MENMNTKYNEEVELLCDTYDKMSKNLRADSVSAKLGFMNADYQPLATFAHALEALCDGEVSAIEWYDQMIQHEDLTAQSIVVRNESEKLYEMVREKLGIELENMDEEA